MTGILIFSGTLGFRHDSIEAGVRTVEELAAAAGVETVSSEASGIFNSELIKSIDAVVWMQASGTGLLDFAQRNAYEEFTRRGGGFAGVHAASDAERDWPLFNALIGARFRAHPAELQSAEVRIERPADESALDIPDPWVWTDEWYAFDTNPRSSVEVIATISEDTYSPADASMGADHPLVWRTQVGAASAWYTALGHDSTAYDDPIFRLHLWGGIKSVISADSENRTTA